MEGSDTEDGRDAHESAKNENEGNRNFALRRETKAPDQWHRNAQDDDVGGEIDAGSGHVEGLRNHAMGVGKRLVPGSFNGPAAEDVDKSCGDFEAHQDANKNVDDPMYTIERKQAGVEQQDRDFDEWNDIRVEGIEDIKRLYITPFSSVWASQR